MNKLTLFGVLCAATCLSTVPSAACSIPVFQWALDNWEPDAHELVLFHSGPLDADAQGLVETCSTRGKSNLRVNAIDVSKPLDKGAQALWNAQDAPPLPWAVLRASWRDPSGAGAFDKPVWAGHFDGAALKALVDSPVRQQLTKEILDGKAGVWIFVDSGQSTKDDAAFERLQSQLKAMPAHLSAIALELNPQLEKHPGEYAFSLVRISKNDAAENALIQLLLHTEPDLPTVEEPMAFPVYGRGRVLYALVGAGVNEANIREACEFLVGGCSCLVKDDNPGTDLLMAVDWDARIDTAVSTETAPPPLPSREVIAAAQAQQSAVKEVPRAAFGKSILIGLAIALAVVAAVTFAAARTSRKEE